MRFNSINIYSAYRGSEKETKDATGMIRESCEGVCEMYIRLLHYYDNANCKSLNIACDESCEAPFLEHLMEGFPVVHVPFNLAEYRNMNPAVKGEFWLEIILKAIDYVGRQWDWDLKLFHEIGEQLREKNFQDVWRYRKLVKSLTGKWSAGILVEQDVEAAKIYLQVLKERKEEKRVLLKETASSAWVYGQWLGKITWIDDDNLEISCAARKEEISI